MSPKQGQSQLDWILSKQFAIWLAITVPAFVIIGGTLKMLQPGVLVVFTAGILFNEAVDPFMDWLQDWKAAEQEVAEV